MLNIRILRCKEELMNLYKITDEDGRTRVNTQWGENITHRAKEKGKTLCSNQVMHAYTDPYMAVFFNPIGGNYDDKTMLLWEAKGRVIAKAVDKVGCKQLTTIRQVKKPIITTEQRVEIAIRCAVQVYKNTKFIKWANGWLSNKDRTVAAAGAAGAAAVAAAEAAWAAVEAAEKIDIITIIKEVVNG
jgi:hypothetical protein